MSDFIAECMRCGSRFVGLDDRGRPTGAYFCDPCRRSLARWGSQIPKVVVTPGGAGSLIARIVTDGTTKTVEVWEGPETCWTRPGTITVSEVLAAPLASPALLASRGFLKRRAIYDREITIPPGKAPTTEFFRSFSISREVDHSRSKLLSGPFGWVLRNLRPSEEADLLPRSPRLVACFPRAPGEDRARSEASTGQ
jgi:hypothetical protein